MLSEASFDSGSHQMPAGIPESVITFDEIKADDTVLIRTRNSEYRFAMIDPVRRRGMLSGGSIGEHPREAVLIETRSRDVDGVMRDSRGLKIGSRALFYLSSGVVVERVTTSMISGVTLVKTTDAVSLVS